MFHNDFPTFFNALATVPKHFNLEGPSTIVVTKTRNEPQRATTTHNDPQRPHNDPQRSTMT